MKYTLEDINQAKNKVSSARCTCDKMKVYDSNFTEQCNKVNRLLREYKRIKGSYFNGNN